MKVSFGGPAHAVFQPVGWDEVNRNPEQFLKFQPNTDDVHEAGSGREIDQQVEIAALAIVASGDAPEDANVADSVTAQEAA